MTAKPTVRAGLRRYLAGEKGKVPGMKRDLVRAVPTLLLALAAAALAQTVIENPGRPKADNAARVISPTEVTVISDEGSSAYFFKWPNALVIGPDSSLLLRDSEQVLQFDANGKFLRNLFKKGQGPGEMPWPGTPLATAKHLVVYAHSPDKLVFFDRTGRFEKEIPVRPEGRSGLTPIGYQAGRFYFKWSEFPTVSGGPSFIDNPQLLLAVGEADGSIATLATFVTRAFVVAADGGGGMFDITSLIAAPFQGRDLALVHTGDYLIKLYDPAAGAVVREFRRDYPRVKGEPLTEAEKKGGIIINGKHYTRPERKFENDIKNLLARQDGIWVVTSTKDKDKGILIDVFDEKGVYRDCFWLKLQEAALTSLGSPGQCVLDGDLLWVVERAEDETSTIRKYRVFL